MTSPVSDGGFPAPDFLGWAFTTLGKFDFSGSPGDNSSLSCGQYFGDLKNTFYINRNGNVSLDPEVPPRIAADDIQRGNAIYPMGTRLSKSSNVSIELKKIVQSVERNTRFTLNTWKFNSTSNEIMFYVHDILDNSSASDLEGKKIGNYTIHISHDSEFEATRSGVFQQLMQYREDPAYQIANVAMITDRINDSPANYAELWVDKFTLENKELDNMMINGWTLKIYLVK